MAVEVGDPLAFMVEVPLAAGVVDPWVIEEEASSFLP